jgi:hypothetical protein
LTTSAAALGAVRRPDGSVAIKIASTTTVAGAKKS